MIPSISVLKNLLQIPGFGPKTAIVFLSAIGISPSTKFQNLDPFKQDLLLQALASLRKSSNCTIYNSNPCAFPIDKILIKEKQDNIHRYISNLSYRGGRLRLGFPVNGGRTRSNSKTAKKLKI